MLLQHLLFRCKRNRGRRRCKFGDYGTAHQGNRGRRRAVRIAICQNALPLRNYFGRGSDHLRLPHLVGVDVYRRLPDRLSRRKRVLGHCHDGSAIYVTDVRNIYVRDIDIRDPRVCDIHLADITIRYMIRRIVRLARAEWKPRYQAPTAADRDAYAEACATDEGDQRWSVVRMRFDGPRNPTPTIIDIRPASIVEWCEPPGFIVNPSPAPRLHPSPAAILIRNPAYLDAR